MAKILSQQQVINLLNRKPPGTTNTGIIAGLRKRGFEIEGFEQASSLDLRTPQRVTTKRQTQGFLEKVSSLSERTIGRVAKGVGSFLTSTEQKFGETIGQAPIAKEFGKQLVKQELAGVEAQQRLITKIKQTKFGSPQRNRLVAELKKTANLNPDATKELSKITPASDKSTKRIIGEAIGVAADIALFGNFKGFKLVQGTGKLAVSPVKAVLKHSVTDLASKIDSLKTGTLVQKSTGFTSKVAQLIAKLKPKSPAALQKAAIEILKKHKLLNARTAAFVSGSVSDVAIVAKGLKPVFKTATRAFLGGAKKAAPTGAAFGAAFGASEALQEDKPLGEVAKTTATRAAVGVFLSAIIGGLASRKAFLAPTKAEKLRQKAIAQYQKGLRTTKEKFKDKADKIIPELLDQRLWGTRKKLLAKAEKGIALSKKEYAKLGELQGMIETTGLIGQIDDRIAAMTHGGRVTSTNVQRVTALKNLKADILSLEAYNEVVSGAGAKVQKVWQERLRKLGAEYGDEIYGSRKAIKTIEDNKTLSQVKKVDASIRSLLNSNNPEYAQINKVYHLNQELADILNETNKRTGGHLTFGLRRIMEGVGGISAAVGISAGTGKPLTGIVAGAALISMAELFNSSWWNTAQAVHKAKVADQILKIPYAQIGDFLSKLAIRGWDYYNRELAD